MDILLGWYTSNLDIMLKKYIMACINVDLYKLLKD